ncbi:acyltransferase family protein [Photobacterium indicum]|uniref:acyltransferase family protein n=1 Tax=Photobacterium indicum TaxID=81447 RepID=UPI003D0FB6E4
MHAGRYGAIDGLRGILAIGVFIHHYIITYKWANEGVWVRPDSDFFNHLGQASVGLFFIITGYLFSKKMIISNNSDWVFFFRSRFFRVYPMFIFVTLIVAWYSFYITNYKVIVQPSSFLLEIKSWLLFYCRKLNGNIFSGRMLAGVTWTLSYEWLFYLSLPMISTIYRFKAVFVLFAIFVVYFSVNPEVVQIYIWSFNTSLFVFFLWGFLVAQLQVYKKELAIGNLLGLLVVSSLFSFLVYEYDGSFGFEQSALLTAVFMLFSYGFDLFGLLKTKFILILGDISYSIYLNHGLFLYFIFSVIFPGFCSEISFIYYMLLMPFVFIFIFIFSLLTYKYIEKPMIIYGKKMMVKNVQVV